MASGRPSTLRQGHEPGAGTAPLGAPTLARTCGEDAGAARAMAALAEAQAEGDTAVLVEAILAMAKAPAAYRWGFSRALSAAVVADADTRALLALVRSPDC